MNEAFSYVMKTAHEKQAGLMDVVSKGGAIGNSVGGLVSGGLLLKALYNRIRNDIQRKAIIEDLSLNDPILKKVDKAQLLEWYASIYNASPKVSADKAAVRELLRNFAAYGKVDIQTIKLLSETEKNLSPKPSAPSWYSLLEV